MKVIKASSEVRKALNENNLDFLSAHLEKESEGEFTFLVEFSGKTSLKDIIERGDSTTAIYSSEVSKVYFQGLKNNKLLIKVVFNK